MIKPAPHQLEMERLQALFGYEILDTEPEKGFDELTHLASLICDVPISLISLVDPERQWFKSKVGLSAAETSRDIAFCSHAIHKEDVMVVNDALKDERFHDNPLVTSDPNIRFYAGAPLLTNEKLPLGTLCVIDTVPRELSNDQIEALRILAKQVMVQLDLRRNLDRQRKNIAELQRVRNELRNAIESEVRTSQSKTRFLANMSHEIRNPMNGIMGGLSLLERTNLSDDQTQLLDVVQSSTKGLLTIINDILDFSKIDSGKLHLESIPFSLPEMMEDIEKMFQASARKADLEFQITIDSGCSDLWQGDPNRIRQILINLTGNALKFTKQGHVLVRASQRDLQDSSQLAFEISDTGIGMSEEAQRMVFEEFTQAEPGTARRFGGTGLGLTICRGLVDLMDGRIELQSESEQGSSFTVILPLTPLKNKPGNSDETRHEKLPCFGKRILVAEDQRVNRLVVRRMLESLGCEVDEAEDGAEAIELLSKGRFDLVLMDVHMPNLDGLKAAQYIGQLPEKQPPIVAMTANAFAEDRELCKEAGMQGFLAKPIHLAALSNELARWFTS